MQPASQAPNGGADTLSNVDWSLDPRPENWEFQCCGQLVLMQGRDRLFETEQLYRLAPGLVQ
jgi:hypothetical protein